MKEKVFIVVFFEDFSKCQLSWGSLKLSLLSEAKWPLSRREEARNGAKTYLHPFLSLILRVLQIT